MMRVRSGFLEASGLVLAGLGMGVTALGPDYWRLLNPKFQPLTLAAGIGCVLMGLALLTRGAGRLRLPRFLALLAFLGCLALFHSQGARLGPCTNQGTNRGTASDLGGFAPPPGLSGETLARTESQAPRLTLHGREYLRLNTAELCNLAAGNSLDLNGGRFVTRGLVLTSPELSARGMYALARVQIVCCLADAVAVGVFVRGEPPVGVGQWARVAGRAVAAGTMGRELEQLVSGLGLPDVLLTYVDAGLVLEAEESQATEPPPLPYIFEVRGAEPFAF